MKNFVWIIAKFGDPGCYLVYIPKFVLLLLSLSGSLSTPSMLPPATSFTVVNHLLQRFDFRSILYRFVSSGTPLFCTIFKSIRFGKSCGSKFCYQSKAFLFCSGSLYCLIVKSLALGAYPRQGNRYTLGLT